MVCCLLVFFYLCKITLILLIAIILLFAIVCINQSFDTFSAIQSLNWQMMQVVVLIIQICLMMTSLLIICLLLYYMSVATVTVTVHFAT